MMQNLRWKMQGLLAVLALLFWLFLPIAASAVEVSDPTIHSTGNQHNLHFTLSDRTEYNVFTLENPPRLVVDISNGQWKGANTLEEDKAEIVKRLRVGNPSADTLRLVLDLANPPSFSDGYYLLPANTGSPHQLVLRFQAKSPNLNNVTSTSGYKGGSILPVPIFKPLTLPGYEKTGRNTRGDPIPVQKPKRPYYPLIVLDPGHGGVDPGAISKTGTQEKRITLTFAYELKNLLEAADYRVKMTRYKDDYVKLQQRVDKARTAGGDIFLSIHADSNPKPSTRGLSVYTISENRAQRVVKSLARRADTQDVLNGINLANKNDNLQHVMIDLVQRQTKNISISFAEMLVDSLGEEARLLRNTHRHASLQVLTGVDIPSALLELGYLSNADEDRLLNQPEYRKRLTRATKEAIDNYFTRYPPEY